MSEDSITRDLSSGICVDKFSTTLGFEFLVMMESFISSMCSSAFRFCRRDFNVDPDRVVRVQSSPMSH